MCVQTMPQNAAGRNAQPVWREPMADVIELTWAHVAWAGAAIMKIVGFCCAAIFLMRRQHPQASRFVTRLMKTHLGLCGVVWRPPS